MSLEDWRKVHRTNLDGVFLGCRTAIRAMRPAKTGAIINISSRSGQVGIPGAAAYASSKAAVRNHSKTVALWCAQQGLAIRCNSIHPGAILTPMWEHLLGSGTERGARMAAHIRDTPLKHFGTPEEVAAMAVFLASDEAPYVTGSEFNIDGGLLGWRIAGRIGSERRIMPGRQGPADNAKSGESRISNQDLTPAQFYTARITSGLESSHAVVSAALVQAIRHVTAGEKTVRRALERQR